MIKLKLNKFRLTAIIKIVELVCLDLSQYLKGLNYATVKRVEVSAHIDELHKLNVKMKKKYLDISHKPEHQFFHVQVTKMQGYILMLYKDNRLAEASGFDVGTMQEISVPIFKQLLQ